MSLPGNGIFVVQGEMAMLVTAMRRSTRWGSHSFLNEEYDVLMRTFQDLKTILNQVDDLRLLDPPTFLSPFLEVIRSKETTGPVTSLALSAVHKFLSYGLIDPTHPSIPATVEDIADAVTHARFVGTDHSSDGVVLMKILQVLHTLMLSPEGAMLTDESVCEIMLSCFRICFETRLTELLRRNAEQCLRDMTQLIFMRLPQFAQEDANVSATTLELSLKKRDKTRKKIVPSTLSKVERKPSLTETPTTPVESDNVVKKQNASSNRQMQDKNLMNESEITIEPLEQLKSPSKKHGRHSSMDLATDANTSITQLLEKCVSGTAGTHAEEDTKGTENIDENIPEIEPEDDTAAEQKLIDEEADIEGNKTDILTTEDSGEKLEEYVNNRGIRFTPQTEAADLQPYGLVCVKELFRFLISLCNPLDSQNTSAMVHLGLCLVGTALEVSADHIAKYESLLQLVKDQLCRNLISLLSTERISIFALDLQVSFLLFEALRFHLKYQIEAFFKKIIEIISADTTKAIYELKEIHHLALEYLAQMFRIPGFCTEMYLNFDCDVYCMDVFEELTKLLSQNVVSSTAYNIHTLSLEALMTIVEAIEMAGNQIKAEAIKQEEPSTIEEIPEPKYGRCGHISLELGGMDDASVISDHVMHDISHYVSGNRLGRHKLHTDVPSETELQSIKELKKWITRGTEIFNTHPEKGIDYLMKNGALSSPLDPKQIATFLRECSDLDKKMIGEYICKRSSRGEDDGPSVLGAFADSFDFAGVRIDQALRMYLETFRLPGEAPLIFLVMERFAERWHSTNGEPFANTDAAFRLAYAIIMLNMDQHNHNAKKLNVPMTVEDFVKNLRGCNGNGDFDQSLLEAIFHSIKNEEMIMPAERVGPVRDAYLWRVLQRRDKQPAARYLVSNNLSLHRALLFNVAGLRTVTALSAAFERAPAPTTEEIEMNSRDSVALYALRGLERCAALTTLAAPTSIASNEDKKEELLTIDTLLLTLCKFTGLTSQSNYVAIGVSLGQSTKCQLALQRACALCGRHGDNVRDAWGHMVEIVKTLYIGRLLPKPLIEAEDYLAPNGTVSLIREAARGSDAGLFSSLYSYIALGETGLRAPTPHEKVLIDAATQCVAKCSLPSLLITETKFLQLESLQELVRALIAAGAPPDSESLQMNPQLEDITIFFLELLGKTLIQNRDRALHVWEEAGAHLSRVVEWSWRSVSRDSDAAKRCVTALLRTAARLMRSEHCAPALLQHLTLLMKLPYKLFYHLADVISCGLYELVKTSAQNVHTAEQWRIVFALLAAAGAGAWPREAHASATSSRSEGSSDESERRPTSASDTELAHSPRSQGWILVKSETSQSIDLLEMEAEDVALRVHRSSALARCCEALALVVRDVAHVTPYNCRLAVRTVRLFVCATLHGGKKPLLKSNKRQSRRRGYDESSDEEENTLDQYHLVSIQLLDLMHTLHSRTAQIFKWWRDESDQGQGSEEYDLWEVAWMPLLQGIALYCTDRRKQVANSAVAYLQRALLAPGLAAMGGSGWEACFQKVLFPLLERLPSRADTAARADTIMCKVFLHHLSALSSRPTFGALWLRVIAVQRSLVETGREPLTEAALESLKNAVLVMHSVKIFSNGDGYTDLWYITWEKIGEFLPTLKDELFPEAKEVKQPTNLPSHMQPPIPSSLPTLMPVAQPPPQSPPVNIPNIQTNINSQSGSFTQGNIPVLTPQNIPQSNINTQNIPVNQSNAIPPQTILSQSPPQGNIPILTPSIIPQTNILSQSPPIPVQPVSGMVPIRNTIQGGLTSSVLLQPLNEMISTSIGVPMPTQMPYIYPTMEQTKVDPIANVEQPILASSPPTRTILDLENGVEQTELYSEYLSNPYNEAKEVSTVEATIYDPKKNSDVTQTTPANEVSKNPLLANLEQKSFSANVSPMHTTNKGQFGSSDNIKKEESSIFNFSSYFGSSNDLIHGSEVFDNLMSTQEG